MAACSEGNNPFARDVVPIVVFVSSLAILAMMASGASPSETVWLELQPGVLYASIPVADAPKIGDGRLHVVRIDSKRARLVVRSVDASGGDNRTAGQWAEDENLTVVINAGMYETDHRTHTGRMRVNAKVNSRSWVKAYKSLFTIDTKGQAQLRDIDGTAPAAVSNLSTVVQNLRLIAGPGRNVWSKNNKRWSEAAIAMDDQGRILFVFSRTPFTMRRFNHLLLASKLGITHAQHAEGGPEASLSIRSKALKLDLAGSYETDFNENDENRGQWNIPNVIGVAKN